jgi:chondroitin 4-sulfotransferase 11
LPLSLEHKCLFIHIPRTGGTTLTKILNIDINPHLLNGVYEMVYSKNCPSLVLQFQHLCLQQILCLGYPQKYIKDLFKVCFVRNPWDRVVSDYFTYYHKHFSNFRDYVFALKKIVTYINDNYTHDIHTEFYIQYSKLVYNLIGERRWVDAHFFPQYRFIEDRGGQLTIDYIGRFENYHNDVITLLSRLNICCEIPKLNSSMHPPYQDVYDSETKNIVENIYQRDIYLFDYIF